MTNTTINYNGTTYTVNYCDPATIATAIRTYLKANHPECKWSVTRRNFEVLTVAVMEAPFEVFTAEAKQQAETDHYYGFCESALFSENGKSSPEWYGSYLYR